MNPSWPVEPAAAHRDLGLRTAGDLALAGILVSLASLPVFTAGAAFGTASEAIHHFLEYGRWPALADLTAAFRRRLVPGLFAGPAVLGAVLLVALDLAALRHGVVPGGAPMSAAVLLAALLGAAYLGLRVVRAGTSSPVPARPLLLGAAAVIVLLTVVLGMLVHPVLVLVMVGYALFALHTAVRRLGRPPHLARNLDQPEGRSL